MKDSTTDRAHELWSAAQLAPGEGIEDGVARIAELLALPAPAGEPEMPEVDDLAQEIRRVDGNHSLGAGALAEALMPFFSAYGDARAEHARRVAYPLADALQALVEDSQHANHADCEDGGYCPVRDARLALAEFDAIRAAAPPHGEHALKR